MHKLIFGGVEDGARVVPEPLLDDDITYNSKEDTVLLRVACALEVGSKKGISVAKMKSDTGEFGDLLRFLADKKELPSMFTTMGEGAVMKALIGAGRRMTSVRISGKGKVRRRKKKKRRRRLSKERSDPSKARLDNKEAKLFDTFVRAAQYTRGKGASLL